MLKLRYLCVATCVGLITWGATRSTIVSGMFADNETPQQANNPTAQPAAATTPLAPNARSRSPSHALEGPHAVVPVTLDRFNQAARISKLAAEHQMYELSLRAVRESLRTGPPIQVQSADPRGMRRIQTVTPLGSSAEDQSVNQQVEARLFELDGLWKQHKAPAEHVYETLAADVLPEARPGEIFLYQIPLASGSIQRPRSVTAILARWAAAASGATVRNGQNLDDAHRHAQVGPPGGHVHSG